MSYNRVLFVYVAVFGLSLFRLVGAFVNNDAEAVQAALADRISPSTYAGLLLVVAVGLAALWLSKLIPAILAGSVPAIIEEAGQ